MSQNNRFSNFKYNWTYISTGFKIWTDHPIIHTLTVKPWNISNIPIWVTIWIGWSSERLYYEKTLIFILTFVCFLFFCWIWRLSRPDFSSPVSTTSFHLKGHGIPHSTSPYKIGGQESVLTYHTSNAWSDVEQGREGSPNNEDIVRYNQQHHAIAVLQRRLILLSIAIFFLSVLASIIAVIDIEFSHSTWKQQILNNPADKKLAYFKIYHAAGCFNPEHLSNSELHNTVIKEDSFRSLNYFQGP